MARMRNAGAPSRRRTGTWLRNAMSSSMVMTSRDYVAKSCCEVMAPIHGAGSWHQLIAAGFGHQDGGHGGVLLDLLPQAIDMRLQRVSGDAGIVAPDFLQQ